MLTDTYLAGIWILIGETFPTRTRAKQGALSTAANWLWVRYSLVNFFPILINFETFRTSSSPSSPLSSSPASNTDTVSSSHHAISSARASSTSSCTSLLVCLWRASTWYAKLPTRLCFFCTKSFPPNRCIVTPIADPGHHTTGHPSATRTARS